MKAIKRKLGVDSVPMTLFDTTPVLNSIAANIILNGPEGRNAISMVRNKNHGIKGPDTIKLSEETIRRLIAE